MADITGPVTLGDIPDEATHPPRAPWYRRPVTWLAVGGLVIGGLATTLALTLTGASTPHGAGAILARDGYTLTVETSDPGPLIAGSGMTPAEAALMRQLVSAAAVGTKGGTDELVLTLTPAGLAIFSIVTSDQSTLKQLGLPADVHVRMDHGYLVLWGPDSTFTGPASGPVSGNSGSGVPGTRTLDQLKPGDCLTGSDLGLSTSSPWPDSVTVVRCTQQHIAEVFFAADAWPQSRAYPGDNAVNNQADNRCNAAFTAYDGTANDNSNFSYDFIDPAADDWASGDRLLVCVAYYPTSQHPGGKLVDYSIKGSQQ